MSVQIHVQFAGQNRIERDRETERYRERKYAKCYISFVKLISRVSVARTFDVNVGNCSWKFLLVCINVAIIVV